MFKLSQVVGGPAERRILHIAGDSKFGGAAQSLLDIIRLCSELGYPSEVLSTDPQAAAFFEAEGIPVKKVDCIRREINIINDIRGLIRLYRFLRKERYLLVHTHTSKAGAIGRIAARLAGVPMVIHTVHGFAFHEATRKLRLAVFVAIEKLGALFCDKVVFVSHFHAGWAYRLGICGPRKAVVVLNGVGMERATANRDRDDVRAELGVKPDEVVLFNSSRMAQEKGLEHLISCLPMLSSAIRAKVRVVLAGEGPFRSELERLVRELQLEEQVRFLGYRDDVGDLLNACDIFVMPTEREGLSISLLEAMAAGKLIVTTTIGSNLELTRNGECAILVPPREPASLVAAISQVIDEPRRFTGLAQAARRIYRENYTRQRMVSDYRTFFQDVLRQCSLDTALTRPPSVTEDLAARRTASRLAPTVNAPHYVSLENVPPPAIQPAPSALHGGES